MADDSNKFAPFHTKIDMIQRRMLKRCTGAVNMGKILYL